MSLQYSKIINKSMQTSIIKAGILTLCGIILLFILSFVPFSRPSNIAAQVGGPSSGETPYGGLNAVTIQCTCAADSLHYFQDYVSKSLIVLLYKPGQSVLFSNFNIYGTYFLGTWKRGSAQCSMYVGEECEDIDADGTMGSAPGTGTS